MGIFTICSEKWTPKNRTFKQSLPYIHTIYSTYQQAIILNSYIYFYLIFPPIHSYIDSVLKVVLMFFFA